MGKSTMKTLSYELPDEQIQQKKKLLSISDLFTKDIPQVHNHLEHFLEDSI